MTLVTVIGYGGAVSIHPYYLDNLVYFSLAARPNPSSFFTGSFTTYFPGYRPLGTFSFWVQYQFAGLSAWQYFVFNIAVLWGCGVAVYALVLRLTGSRLAGAFAGSFLLVDDRTNILVWNLTERQNAFACLFGLLALLIVYGSYRERHRRLASVGLFALLLAAALSKEYGLVFSAAVVVAALTIRGPGWKAVALASFGAVATYAALRLALAGGATTPFCDQMGFFSDRRQVCYNTVDTSTRLAQYAYNVGATFVGTLVPSAFDNIGAISIPGQFGVRGFVLPTLVAAGALFAAVRRPRLVVPLLTLLVVNTVLSFIQYRTRNQLVAMAGLYVAGGMGLAFALRSARDRPNWRIASRVGLAMLFLLLVVNTQRTSQAVHHIRDLHGRMDPCTSLRAFPRDIDRNVVRAIKERDGLPNPTCQQ